MHLNTNGTYLLKNLHTNSIPIDMLYSMRNVSLLLVSLHPYLINIILFLIPSIFYFHLRIDLSHLYHLHMSPLIIPYSLLMYILQLIVTIHFIYLLFYFLMHLYKHLHLHLLFCLLMCLYHTILTFSLLVHMGLNLHIFPHYLSHLHCLSL